MNRSKLLGISLEAAHSAYHDAHATAALMTACLTRLGPLADLTLSEIGVADADAETRWPRVPVSGKSYTRPQAIQDTEQAPSFIAHLVSKLPASTDARPGADAYYALLDLALEDRRMRRMLGVSTQVCEALFEEIASEDHPERAEGGQNPPRTFSASQYALPGTLNCRIDGAPARRSFAEEAATNCGMVVKKNVSRKLDILVVADPDSMSGKARKARDCGVRIIAEPVFWHMVGVDAE